MGRIAGGTLAVMLMMLTWWPAMTLRLAECVSFLGVGGRNSGSARDLPSGHQHQHQPAPTTLLLSNCKKQNTSQHQPGRKTYVYNTKHITSSHQTCSNNPQHFFCPTRCSDNTTLAKCIVRAHYRLQATFFIDIWREYSIALYTLPLCVCR